MNIKLFIRLSRRPPSNRGFTLIEILVVIGMLAILSTVVLVAVNPLRQFAEARNSERQNDVAAILNAISERIADNGGNFVQPIATRNDNCTWELGDVQSQIAKGILDIRPCLVPTYISELPHDPLGGTNTCTTADCDSGGEDYNLLYTVAQDSTTGRVTVCSPLSAEPTIANSVPFCLTR